MNKRALSAAVSAAVLASLGSPLLGPGPARADSAKILAAKSVADMEVDSVHQRVFVSDRTAGKIFETGYDGTVLAVREGLTGVQDLLLSSDGSRLYAAVPGRHAILALTADGLAEVTRYDTGFNTRPATLASAGGRIWFGYTTTAGVEGLLGSLDLRGETPKVALAQGDGRWYAAPELTAAANSATVAGWDGAIGVFDVSGETPVRTALGGDLPVTDAALTPDGTGLAVVNASPNQVTMLRTSDLHKTAEYPIEFYPNAVDIAADGTIAAGSFSWYEPDLHIITRAGTLVRQYDLPNTGNSSGADTLVRKALAWAPDGKALFAVSENSYGAYTLRSYTEPKKSAPNLTVTGPASATRGAGLTLAGTVTGTLPVSAGAPVSVTRVDLESPGGKSLGTVPVTTAGTFAVTDKPPAGGTVTYRFSYAGDDTHTAASASRSVSVSRTATTLTLNRKNNTVYAYGSKVSFTAHLGKTYTGRTVEIWSDPYGSDQPNRLVRKTKVNSKGDLAATLTLTRNTRVSAVFAGDARTADKTVAVTVLTNVRVSMKTQRAYKTAKVGGTSYSYFHARTNPRFVTTMTYRPGRAQVLTVEYYAKGAWRTWGWGTFGLASNGTSTVDLIGTHDRNIRMRVRSAYRSGDSGDTLNHTTYGAWTYFIFTK